MVAKEGVEAKGEVVAKEVDHISSQLRVPSCSLGSYTHAKSKREGLAHQTLSELDVATWNRVLADHFSKALHHGVAIAFEKDRDDW